MPPEENAVLICVATGTGIAPYRAFWRRCFYEDVPNYKFSGLFWMFMGVANSDAKLYDNEIQEMQVCFERSIRVRGRVCARGL
jgi:ferredoxin--NADP+ reductase